MIVKEAKIELVDRLTPEQRHKNMKAIKSKDSKIERMLRVELWSRGFRYRKNAKNVYGHPDIVFIGKKVAVFCDSEFWHGYDWTKKNMKSKAIGNSGLKRSNGISKETGK